MEINRLLSENQIDQAILECKKQELLNLATLIDKISKYNIIHDEKDYTLVPSLNELKSITEHSKIRVLLTCNWCTNEDICNMWNRMSKNNDYSWENITIVPKAPYDFICIINKPFRDDLITDPSKTIIFRMEPHMEKHPNMWNSWSRPLEQDFKYVGFHEKYLNNVEWHLAKTYDELSRQVVIKENDLDLVLSSILSDKYKDPGHIKRIDFMKFLEKKGDIETHIFGSDKFMWKNYKGLLPMHNKNDGLLPYKYTFNVENFSIKNYATEKLYDGILAECLVFYSGCFNIRDVIDDRAFVYLELSNFEQDYETIKRAIREDWYTQRLPYIRKAKKQILEELQFFPKLEKIITQ